MFALRAQGLTVVTAQDGMEALDYGLVRAIRSDRDYAELPVIILSSLSDERDNEFAKYIN